MIKTMDKKTRFRIISHYDADGITAASIICKMLLREGYDFHVTLMRNPFTQGIELIEKEDNKIIIFTDMGSGQLEMIKKINAKIIIIDHHQLIEEKTPENIIQINANQCGINGNYEACGATLAYALAKELNPKNIDLASYAIAGATGDKQYIGDFRGYNKNIVDEAIKNNVVKNSIGLKLSELPINEALYYSIEPFFKELSGNKDNIKTFLTKIGIDKSETYFSLDEQSKKKLHSSLMLRLLKQGCELNILDTVIRERYLSEKTYGEMEQFADFLDSTGKGGHREIGLSLCLGDKSSYEKARELEKKYKEKLLEVLLKIEKNGVNEKENIRYFQTEYSSLGGVIGGIATNFILDKLKPLISIAIKDDELHISCRGNQHLVENGLDLGSAMQQIAKKFNGNGGGHKIASGATIKSEYLDQFINDTNEIISKQIKK
jgi:RecJ-like exonuclease